MSSGRVFHSLGAATANDRSSTDTSLDEGMKRLFEVDDRRRLHDGMSATQWSSPAMQIMGCWATKCGVDDDSQFKHYSLREIRLLYWCCLNFTTAMLHWLVSWPVYSAVSSVLNAAARLAAGLRRSDHIADMLAGFFTLAPGSVARGGGHNPPGHNPPRT